MPESYLNLGDPANQAYANTAVIDSTDVSDSFFRAAQMRRAVDQDRYRRQQQEFDQRVAATNFDATGIWERDHDDVMQRIQDVREFGRTNPQAVLDPSSPLYSEFWKKVDDTKYAIGKSTTDKAYFDNYQKLKGQGSDLDTPDNDSMFEQFANTGLFERKFDGMKTPDLYNPIDTTNMLATKIPGLFPKTKTEVAGAGNETITTETEQTDTDKFNAAIAQLPNYPPFAQHALRLQQHALQDPNFDRDMDLFSMDANGNLVKTGKTKLSSASIEEIAQWEQAPLLYKEMNKNVTREGARSSLSGARGSAERQDKISYRWELLDAIKNGSEDKLALLEGLQIGATFIGR
jgi:hypothetical protein